MPDDLTTPCAAPRGDAELAKEGCRPPTNDAAEQITMTQDGDLRGTSAILGLLAGRWVLHVLHQMGSIPWTAGRSLTTLSLGAQRQHIVCQDRLRHPAELQPRSDPAPPIHAITSRCLRPSDCNTRRHEYKITIFTHTDVSQEEETAPSGLG
jgi:hypothetical protein